MEKEKPTEEMTDEEITDKSASGGLDTESLDDMREKLTKKERKKVDDDIKEILKGLKNKNDK
jgi:hypothetical protein